MCTHACFHPCRCDGAAPPRSHCESLSPAQCLLYGLAHRTCRCQDSRLFLAEVDQQFVGKSFGEMLLTLLTTFGSLCIGLRRCIIEDGPDAPPEVRLFFV
jgi:hypothetical protein